MSFPEASFLYKLGTVAKKQSGEICSGNMKYFYKNSSNYCSAFYNISTGMAAARIGENFFKGIPGYQIEVLLAGIDADLHKLPAILRSAPAAQLVFYVTSSKNLSNKMTLDSGQ